MQNNQKELILLEDLGMHYPNETSNKKVRYGISKCYCGNEFKTRQHKQWADRKGYLVFAKMDG